MTVSKNNIPVDVPQFILILCFTCLLSFTYFSLLLCPYVVGALYVAEIAQPNIRGGLANCLSFSVALGITMAMFLGAIFTWRIVAIVCCLPQITGKMVEF